VNFYIIKPLFIKAPANNGGQFASRTMPRRPVDQVCSSFFFKVKTYSHSKLFYFITLYINNLIFTLILIEIVLFSFESN